MSITPWKACAHVTLRRWLVTGPQGCNLSPQEGTSLRHKPNLGEVLELAINIKFPRVWVWQIHK